MAEAKETHLILILVWIVGLFAIMEGLALVITFHGALALVCIGWITSAHKIKR